MTKRKVILPQATPGVSGISESPRKHVPDVYVVCAGARGEGLSVRGAYSSLKAAKRRCLEAWRVTPILVAHGVWVAETSEEPFDEVLIQRMKVRDE